MTRYDRLLCDECYDAGQEDAENAPHYVGGNQRF